MKYPPLYLIMFFSSSVFSQTIQLGYDVRHSIDPQNNERDFVTFSFETYKSSDYGSLLMKMDADFNGRNNNLGKLYVQISHSLKFWSFPVSLHLEYSGGMGFIGETTSGYHISNSYSIGAAYPFHLMNSWASTSLLYRYTNLDRPSHDLMVSFWWGKDIHDKIRVTAYFVLWTINKNHGDAWTQHLSGKKFSGIGEPRIWYNINKSFAIGSEIKLYYHVYSYSNHLLIYQTIAVKYEF